jgi:hypothetical protein
MARKSKFIALAAGLAALLPSTGHADQPGGITLTAELVSQQVGNTAHDYLEVTSVGQFVTARRPVPTRRGTAYCYWSSWSLIRINAISHARTYGVSIYDGCNNDTQVFPVPRDIRQGSCNNDDALYPSGKFSVCPIIPEGHVPAGLPFDHRCEALTEVDTSLLADLTPETYDSTKPTTLTLTTSFASDMTQRLSEGTCSDVLDWQAISWTLHWPDGAIDHAGTSGHDGITRSHTLQPSPAGGAQQSDITVVAHLHVIGQALDFDASGNTYVRNVDGYVDISNHDGATGAGTAPVDVPPQLATGAVAVGQAGDGTLSPPDPAATPQTKAITIRGRLLQLYPRPIVIRPGVELVDGAEVGRATSTVLTWTYTGTTTDAPPAEGTRPGQRGSPSTPIAVQYDHAERTDALGRPLDEAVPITMVVRTQYPDGAVLDTTLSGVIDVAIWYAGLTQTG